MVQHTQIQIWDNHNKQWLEPMAIFFDRNNRITRVTACKIGDEPLSNGWYDLKDSDLSKIAIIGNIDFNTNLLPHSKPMSGKELEILSKTASRLIKKNPTNLNKK